MFGRVKPPEDGIYKDIDETEYHNWDCFSYSMVKSINRSMKHLELWMEEQSKKLKDKKHINMGTLIETLVFEPKLFDEKFELYPEFSKTAKGEKVPFSLKTKDGQAKKVEIEEKGKTPITSEMLYHAENAVESLKNNSVASPLLFKGSSQVSIVWTDNETGVKCKCRLDNIDEYSNSISDLKVPHDAYFPAFIKNIGNMGYHIQGGAYQNATEYFFNDIFTYTIVGVEPSPPYGVTTIALREESLELGMNLFKKGVRKYSQMLSIKPNDWTCYDERIYDSDIPAYLLNKGEDDE